jgi:uncharacterized protein (TIGR03437 family)
MNSRILLGTASLLVAMGLQAQVAVVNGASFRKDQPVAAGSIASAFGTFTGTTETQAAAVPLPKSLGGARVIVGSTECALFYASDKQINFQVPGNLGPGTHQVRVAVAGRPDVVGSFVVIDPAPGLFNVANTGTPARAAALNQNYSTNAGDNPEGRGKVIQIYATGGGLLNGTIADGAPAGSSPLLETVTKPKVYIAGVEAVVEFSGLAPNYVGLWQINARIPDMPFVKGQVPVQVFMNGVDSNEVSIFVAQ